jgi:phospholipid transport system substrate-binding protein
MQAAIKLIRALACLALTAGFALGATDPAGTVPGGPGPQELMSDLSRDLFAALAKEPAAKRQNADRILPLVDRLLSPHFDREYAGRLVLGYHWRDATPEQRQQFAVALYQRLLRTYAGAVAEWTPDRFKLLAVHADPEALQVTVHTLITNSRHEIVPVDFRLHQTAEGWKIYDVTVDGVSYVRNYRDDTDAEIAQKGLAAAITRLQKSDINAMDRH